MLKHSKTKITDIIFLLLLGATAIIVFWTYHVITNSTLESLSAYTTQTASSLPLDKYTNDVLNYSLAYPLGWTLEQEDIEQKEVVFMADEENAQAKIIVKIYPQNNLPLLAWLEKRIEANGRLPLLEDDSTSVANIPSMYLRLKENENLQSMTVYVPYNNFIYEIKLVYPAAGQASDYKKIFNTITSSFKFLK